eukprot:3039758-Ditylum_brightwellii.AAC.1
MEEAHNQKLEEMKTQLENKLMEKIASIMDATGTKMYDNMKTMMENNMAATSAMIQQPINTAFNRASQ